jgi:two-component system sensor histidine kinase MprB
MTLRGRVGLLAGVAAAVIGAAIGAAVLALFVSQQAAGVDGTLVRAATQSGAIALAIKQKGSEQAGPPVFSAPVSLRNVQLQLFPEGVAVGDATAVGPMTDADVAVASAKKDPYFSDVAVDGQRFRAFTTRMIGTGDGLVRVVYPYAAISAERWRVAWACAAMVLTLGVGTGLLGRALAGRTLAPVARVTAAFDRVRRTGRLDERLAVSGSDEVGQMSRAMNEMLAALEASAQAQKQLVADASHELRTPLTSVLTNLDLLDEDPGLADPKAPVYVDRAREQADRLRRIVDDVIDLARQGQVAPTLVPTRLDLLARRVATDAAARADSVRIDVRTVPSPLLADEDAVSRAVANLVDNAVAWSPPGATVTVECGHDDGRAWVAVADEGPGIPADDLPHVFERFYRSPAARSKPGSGLGLAIVAAVAAAHGGAATASSTGAGTRMVLSLPEAPDAPTPG